VFCVLNINNLLCKRTYCSRCAFKMDCFFFRNEFFCFI